MRSLIVLALVAASLVKCEWSIDQALDGVYWSKVAYCTDAHITEWTCGACPHFPGVTNAKGFRDDALDDSSGFAAYYPAKDQIIYAFRGTINLPGWIEDFDEFQIPYPNCSSTGCKVHEGLYWGYNRVRLGLWDHLQGLVNAHPNATILVTGHSMGAGQSGYGYLDVVLNIKNHVGKKMLYNYGCPRLGNQQFVEYMEKTIEPHGEHFRHTNFGDPIVHLAPIFFDDIPDLGKWLHCPREMFFMNPFANPRTHLPKKCAGNTTNEDPTCADSTPWYDMIGLQNHTTYLDVGLGCFLGPSASNADKLQPKINKAGEQKLVDLVKGKKSAFPTKHKINRLSGRQ